MGGQASTLVPSLPLLFSAGNGSYPWSQGHRVSCDGGTQAVHRGDLEGRIGMPEMDARDEGPQRISSVVGHQSGSLRLGARGVLRCLTGCRCG